MRFGVAILLTFIGYLIIKAGWRLYRAVREDRPDKMNKPKKSPLLDKFGQEYEVEDVPWRDLP